MKLLLVVLMLFLTACGGGSAVAPIGGVLGSSNKVVQTRSTSFSLPAIYTVKKGDTLYSISWRYGMDYKTLAAVNAIQPPYIIRIGQKLRIAPTKPIKTATKKKRKTVVAKPVKISSNRKSTTKKIIDKPPANNHLIWQWPTKGKLLSSYSAKVNSRKGIKIAGKRGQNVVAAAGGKVVYSGSGLARYGNLLIIKHNALYLSAYAHNETLLVKEGEVVTAGQRIARLGNTGTQRYQLHFEIRRNGKPVDPMQFLPR